MHCNTENKKKGSNKGEILEVESVTKQLMVLGGAKMFPSFGTEVMLFPLIESESTGEGGGRECFKENMMS